MSKCHWEWCVLLVFDAQRGKKCPYITCEQRMSRWACAPVQFDLDILCSSIYTTVPVYSVSGQLRPRSACAILSRKEILTIIKSHNSIVNLQKIDAKQFQTGHGHSLPLSSLLKQHFNPYKISLTMIVNDIPCAKLSLKPLL